MLEPSAGGMSKPTVLKCTKEKEKIEKSRTTIFTKRYQSKLHFQFMAGFCHGFQLFPMVFPWFSHGFPGMEWSLHPAKCLLLTAHGPLHVDGLGDGLASVRFGEAMDPYCHFHFEDGKLRNVP
jgi:hypothetical protein